MRNAISLIHNRKLSMKLRHKHIKSGSHTLPVSSSSCVPEGQRKSNFAQSELSIHTVNNTWLYEAIEVKCKLTHKHTLTHTHTNTHTHAHTHWTFIGSTITAPPPSGFLAKILCAASRDQKQSSLMLHQSVGVDAKSGLNGRSRWWEDAWGNSFHSLCPCASSYGLRSPETDTQFQDSLFHNQIVLV